MKEEDLEFIKAFSKLSVTQVCRDLGIDKSNVYTGKASAEVISSVAEEIKKRLDEIMK